MSKHSNIRNIILPLHSRRALRRKTAKTDKTIREMFEGRNDTPEGFCWKIIYRVIDNTDTPLREDYYRYIHNVLDEHRDKYARSTIDITEALLKRIQNEIKRTGRTAHSILMRKYKSSNKNLTLAPATVNSWFNGKAQTAHRYSVSYLLDLYSTLPDKRATKVHKD